MAAKKKITDQEPQLEESAGKFQAALDAVRDYLQIIGPATDEKKKDNYLWMAITSDELGLPRGLYLVDYNLIIYGVDAPTDDQEGGLVQLKLEDETTPATIYQLLLDLYSEDLDGELTHPLTQEQRAAIQEGVVAQLADDGALMITRAALAPITKYIIPHSRLQNKMTVFNLDILRDISLDGQMTLVGTQQYLKFKDSDPDDMDHIAAVVSLAYTGIDSATIKRNKMDGYDVQIMNAISSLYQYSMNERPGEPVILTPQSIWACMNGGKGRAREPQLARLARSLDKWRLTYCTLDITNEIAKHRLKNIPDGSRLVSGKYEGFLLHADKITFKTEKNNIIEGYRILSEPIIFEYNRVHGQIYTVPIELLDTSDKVNNTEDVIAFRGYLVQRIEAMRRGDLDNDVIRLETIYQEAGIEPPELRIRGKRYQDPRRELRKQAKKDRDKIAGILESFKGKGYILGYEEVVKGSSHEITGYRIQLDQLLIEQARAEKHKRK